MLVASMKPAEATFPGGNGDIAFVSDREGYLQQVYRMRPDGTDVRRISDAGPPTTGPTGAGRILEMLAEPALLGGFSLPLDLPLLPLNLPGFIEPFVEGGHSIVQYLCHTSRDSSGNGTVRMAGS